MSTAPAVDISCSGREAHSAAAESAASPRSEPSKGGGGGHSARVNILGSVHQAGGQRGAKAPRHSAPLADFGLRPHYRYEAWTETEAINGHPNGDMNGFLLGCRLT